LTVLKHGKVGRNKKARDKKTMSRSTRIAVAAIAVVSSLEAIGLAGTYLFHSSRVISVDNAQVDGQKSDIVAPATGTLIEWSAGEGAVVHKNEAVGRIQGVGGGPQPIRLIRSPGEGEIVVSDGHEGQYVTQGLKLATFYEPQSTYVTARVAEDDVDDVHVGQRVDVDIDAFPHASVVGVVTQVQDATASRFTIFPSPDQDPVNPQKIDQYLEVRIEIIHNDGATLMPGLGATVEIQKG
jgi:multidrug resistance efflux pump